MPNKYTKGWSDYRLKRYEELRAQGQPKSEAAAVSATIEKQHKAKIGRGLIPSRNRPAARRGGRRGLR